MTIDAAAGPVSNMPVLWGVAPVATLAGSPQSGIAAVRMVAHGPRREVSCPPLPGVHIVSWVLSGERNHRIWNDDRLIHQGAVGDRTLNIVVEGRSPRAVIERRVDVLHIYVPHTLIAASIAAMGTEVRSTSIELIDPRSVNDTVMEHLAGAILESMQGDSSAAPQRLFVDQLGLAIAAHLAARWSNLRGAPAVAREPTKGRLAPWQVKRVTEHLVDRLAEDVSLEDLSKLVGLSTFHLCRAFKRSTGLPPYRWRMQRRIERACELLENTDFPVTEVAAQVGYDDPSQLASAFRKVLGMSPSDYRRRRRA